MWADAEPGNKIVRDPERDTVLFTFLTRVLTLFFPLVDGRKGTIGLLNGSTADLYRVGFVPANVLRVFVMSTVALFHRAFRALGYPKFLVTRAT